MKIISKYKDFYDFMAQDYDADINYVRDIALVNTCFDNLIGQKNSDVQLHTNYNAELGEIRICNFVFGIYPYVYSQPALMIGYRINYYISDMIIILGRDLVDKILDAHDPNTLKSAIHDGLIPFAKKEYLNKTHDLLASKNISFSSSFSDKTIQHLLRQVTWKVECPDIFYKIESPVYIRYNAKLVNDGSYRSNWPEKPKIGTERFPFYVTDISFQRLNYNILKYWFDDLNNMNTYINIENFLWSIKQEPMSNPDNKTKILAHGFDLKTSFRKM